MKAKSEHFIYRILQNTRAGANTKKSRGARVFRSKINPCQAASGDSRTCSFVLMRAHRVFMHVMRTQLTKIKWLLVILKL